LALTLPTRGGHLVGTVLWQTKATEFSLVFFYDYTASAGTVILIHEWLHVAEILEFFLVETVFSQIKGYLKILFVIQK
jgi:hypothetical protein